MRVGIILYASLTFWTMADCFSKTGGAWVKPALITMRMIRRAPWLLCSTEICLCCADIGCSRIGSVMCEVRFDILGYVIMFPKTENLCKTSCFSHRSSDQRFSMPIQCTDRTEEVERPFSTALRSAVDIPVPPSSTASCGASPEDRDLVDSLTKLSLKFPPSADSEYDFLNSNPERNPRIPCTLTEEESVELPMPFVYPTSPSHSSSSSLSQEIVRGPQQVRITGEGLRKLVANYQFLTGLC